MIAKEAFIFDKEAPLVIAAGETRRANEAMRTYYKLPYPRTFVMLVEELQKNSPKKIFLSELKKWCSIYHWHERISLQMEIETRILAEAFARQRTEQIENELKDSRTLRERALEVLRLCPPVEQQMNDSTGNYIIKPASSSEYNAATKMLAESSRLARLALNMPTVNSQVTGKVDSDLTSGGKPIIFTGQVADDERQNSSE